MIKVFCFCDEDEKNQSIPILSLEELERTLKCMTNLRSGNDDGLVREVIENMNIQFKTVLNTHQGMHLLRC